MCTSLCAGKARQLLKEAGPGCHIEAVNPQVRSAHLTVAFTQQWIHDCIERKLLLPTYRYRVLEANVRPRSRHRAHSLQDQVTMSQLQGKHPQKPLLPVHPLPPAPKAPVQPAPPLPPPLVPRKRTGDDVLADLPKAHRRAQHTSKSPA